MLVWVFFSGMYSMQKCSGKETVRQRSSVICVKHLEKRFTRTTFRVEMVP